MPAHSSDFSQHMKGLFQTILLQQQTIEELCNSQCCTAVDELAREIAYPLNEQLAENLDNSADYKNKSYIHPRLRAIWELISIDEITNTDHHASGTNYERTLKNREYILCSTPCAKLLSDILAKPEYFTKAQLKIALSVLRALFFECSVEDTVEVIEKPYLPRRIRHFYFKRRILHSF